jgi:hypothetical protein
MPKIKFKDKQGQEYDIDPAKVTKLAWTDESGQEVAGHGLRGVRRDEEEEEVEGHGHTHPREDEVEGHGVGHPRDDQAEETEGHGFKSLGRDGQEYEIDPSKITTIAWTDDEGEHEVEGHGRYTP